VTSENFRQQFFALPKLGACGALIQRLEILMSISGMLFQRH
jgi:hypothetical protein